MLNVYGTVYSKKQKRLIHLGEVGEETEAQKLASDFLREGYKQGLARSAKAVDAEGNTLFHYGMEEPKATVITVDELNMLDKGYKIL